MPVLHHPLKVGGPEILAYALEGLGCFLHFTFHLAAGPRLVSGQPSPWSLLLNTASHWASSPTCAPGFNAFALWHSSFIHSVSFYYPSFTSATSWCQCACVSCHLDNVQRPLTPPPSFSLPTALRYPHAARGSVQRPKYGHAVPCLKLFIASLGLCACSPHSLA